MPEIPDRHSFKPSKALKQKWLATRKNGYQAGRQWPGFNDTDGYSKDSAWVLLAFIVEMFALIYTTYSGFERASYSGNTIYIYGSIGVVLAFIIFDILGAIFTHHYIAAYQEKRNFAAAHKLAITPPQKGWRFYVGFILILASAFLKIVALIALGRLMIMYYAFFVILYLAVVYVHLNHTMFWYEEYSLRKRVEDEFKRHTNNQMKVIKDPDFVNPFQVFPDTHKFKMKGELSKMEDGSILFGEKKYPQHQLVYHGKNGNEHEYELITRGILLDADIRDLLNTQFGVFQSELVAQCVLVQLKF